MNEPQRYPSACRALSEAELSACSANSGHSSGSTAQQRKIKVRTRGSWRSPSPRTPAGPLDPPTLGFFRLLGVVLNDWVFLLSGVQVAQCIGEPSGVGYLTLSGARNMLNPVREEIKGMVPYFGGGPGRREAHLAGGFHVGQMLEWHRGSEDVVQDPLQARTIGGLPEVPGDIRHELVRAMQGDAPLQKACLENVKHQLTPGYRSSDILGALTGKGLHLRTNQGHYIYTGNPYDLCVEGEGFLVLSSGRLTRCSNFAWDPEGLKRADGVLMGYKNSGRLEAIKIPAEASNLEVTSEGERLLVAGWRAPWSRVLA